MAHYRLTRQISLHCAHFMRGFSTLIRGAWLKMFNQHELQLLIGGTPRPFKISDLRANIAYGHGFHEAHPAIIMFWEVCYCVCASASTALLISTRTRRFWPA
jgi:ubiquitin-protein ligase E3 C